MQPPHREVSDPYPFKASLHRPRMGTRGIVRSSSGTTHAALPPPHGAIPSVRGAIQTTLTGGSITEEQALLASQRVPGRSMARRGGGRNPLPDLGPSMVPTFDAVEEGEEYDVVLIGDEDEGEAGGVPTHGANRAEREHLRAMYYQGMEAVPLDQLWEKGREGGAQQRGTTMVEWQRRAPGSTTGAERPAREQLPQARPRNPRHEIRDRRKEPEYIVID